MSLTIRCRSAPFTTSCTRPSPLHAPSPLGKTSLPSASAPTTRSSRPAGLCWSAPMSPSTYCYLLSSEEHRDADTWGVRLLELSERSFRPDATIADFAGGLRAGQAEALPDVPCRGDVFHALQTATPLVGYLENRAYEAIATRSRLENRQARAEHRQGRKDASLVGQLRYAREAEAAGGDPRRRRGPVGPLAPARRKLAVRGPDYVGRCALYDWVVAELRLRRAALPPPHSTGPLSVGESTGRLAGLRETTRRGSPGVGRGVRGSGHAGRRSPRRAEPTEPAAGAVATRAGVVEPAGARGTAWYAKPWRSCWGRWCVPAA